MLITGRRKIQKLRAAASLLLELRGKHPTKLVLSTYRTPQFLRTGRIPLPGCGAAINGKRPSLTDGGVWERVLATEPDGLVVDLRDGEDFAAASQLVDGRALLLIGITDFQSIDEFHDGSPSEILALASVLEAS